MSSLHHHEILVKDGPVFVKQICFQYSLTLRGYRETTIARQWVIGHAHVVFLITEPKVSDLSTFHPAHPGLHLQNGKYQAGIDTVFDVAVTVTDIDQILTNLAAIGGEILQPKTAVSDSFGSCETAIIKSCNGNVVHTLINRAKYNGTFLPGFDGVSDIDIPDISSDSRIQYVDHLTIVCERGDINGVLKWYEQVFRFTRFLANRTESEEDGFVLDGDIGLRMKVAEYFQCSETMLSHDVTGVNALKLVLGESLVGHTAETNVIDRFIEDHGGPGVQHMGLYTDNIIETAASLRGRGVPLQVPPGPYYFHEGKQKEIASSGEDWSLLRANGILLDYELDGLEKNGKKMYLKQVFTKPIFAQKTFHFELIERHGALGFGTGNIAALWWSAQESVKQEAKSTEFDLR